jgi:predicted nucleic-acid-binding Zn-ribbon protein
MAEPDGPHPEQYEVAGVAVQCNVCRKTEFWQRHAQLNTPLFTFFGLDWANRSALCLVCDNCGYLMWFLQD